MPHEQTHLVGGLYRVNKTLSTSDPLTICTAEQIKTHEAVELALITLPSNNQPIAVRDYFKQLERRQQAQSTRLRHLYDWGQQEKQIYIASAIPRGISLQQILDTENIEIERAIELGQQIGLGLTTLHAQSIAGLDLRPQFITLDTTGAQERVQINDLGLRSLLQQLSPLTTSDQHKGAAHEIAFLDPRYAPPEYLNHEPIGPWSDIYQLGLLLFTMITGRLPFVGKDIQETAILQKDKPLPALRQYKHNISTSLQEILQHATQKDRHSRFANAAALIRALATVQQEQPIQASGPMMALQHSSESENNSYTTEMYALKHNIEHAPTIIGGPIRSQHEGKVTQQLPINDVYAYISTANTDTSIAVPLPQHTEHIAITQPSAILGRLDPKRNVRPDIDLSKLDPKMTISRKHAQLRFTEQVFTLEDLGSRNKTRVGDKVIPPHVPVILEHGDIIVLGSVHLRFEIPGTPDTYTTTK